MAIKNITTDFAGEIGVKPRIVRIETTDSFATITTANYLKSAEAMGYNFYPNDLVAIAYSTNSATTQLFTVSISGETITLEPMAGDVTLPVVSGNFAVFTGTAGALDDAGYSPSDAAKTKVVMATTTTTSGRLAQFNDTAGTIGNAPIAANVVLTTTITTPDVSPNLVSFDVTCGQAALASAGSVILIDSSGSKQYKIRSLQINSGGTNFSGGGGNRLGQVTDGTTVYSVVPAASLQTLANAQWGATAIPNPASAAINTSTVAGADLVFKYSGGTTDYTAGSVVITGIAERVA